jgi:hypothetical protein
MAPIHLQSQAATEGQPEQVAPVEADRGELGYDIGVVGQAKGLWGV